MDEEISIINNETAKEKTIKFFKNNKKKLIVLLIILILIPFSFFSYQIYLDKNKEKISSRYNLAVTKFEKGNNLEIKKVMIEIINSKDKTYSPLALYFIIDNNIEATNEEINRYFDIIINDINLDIEIKNLNIYKKGLFNSSFISENELLLILKPIINSDSFWKPHALILLGEFFIDKNQNQKAREFFSQVISIDTANEKLKTEAKKRLVNIGE
jgi:predicted negative regulator of RcsB-dependent stress response|tara:strand:- start:422 stop:1063 length:642 start_codon:yes stop_codon:yes gene_type:complete